MFDEMSPQRFDHFEAANARDLYPSCALTR
jgi:hypothetical protein